MLSDLGLDGFPSGEPVHVIAPIGVTFLRQRAAQLRVAPSRPRGASSSSVPPPPSSTGIAATVLLLMLMFLHRLLRMIQTFVARWIMS